MATQPQYAAIPRSGGVRISAANPNRDGTGTLVTVFSGTVNGSRVDDITIQAIGATTVGMVRLYLTFDGATNHLIREIPVGAITPTASLAAFSFRLTDLGWLLPATWVHLRASTHNAEAFNVVITRAGDF